MAYGLSFLFFGAGGYVILSATAACAAVVASPTGYEMTVFGRGVSAEAAR